MGDIVKSLRPLVLSLSPQSSNTIHKLRERRAQLSAEVTDVINTLGPEMFPDFDAARIVADPFSGSPTSSKHRRSDSNISGISDTGATSVSKNQHRCFYCCWFRLSPEKR